MRRKLTPGRSAILIYINNMGFVREKAIFVEYKRIILDSDVILQVPFFLWNGKEISGLDCFWVLPEEVRDNDIKKLQYDLIKLQIENLEFSNETGLKIPTKIKDKEIENMANENVNRIQSLIKKLGYDPRDESWIESEMASTKREKNWFAFERKNPLLFQKKWDDMIRDFNKQYRDDISVAEAKNLSKKRIRFILGSFNVRQSGNGDKKDWIMAAKLFEQQHRDIENRMLTWSNARHPNYPLVRTIKPIRFTPGIYFHECIERIPQIFENTKINSIATNIVLRIVSYDPVSRYVKLDFTKDVRTLIKGNEIDVKPWDRSEADYLFWLKPEEIDSHLKILENLN